MVGKKKHWNISVCTKLKAVTVAQFKSTEIKSEKKSLKVKVNSLILMMLLNNHKSITV